MGKFIDLEMLLMFGGENRTEEEFRDFFQKAGFKLTRAIRLGAPINILEGEPVLQCLAA